MSADQIAEIRPGLVEIFSAPEEEDWCVTFELPEDSDVWVQVTREHINFPYTSSDDPAHLLIWATRSLNLDVQLSSWEPGKFATFTHGNATDARALAKLVDFIFTQVLGCADVDYAVDFTLNRLS
jgi:hypothetical protein